MPCKPLILNALLICCGLVIAAFFTPAAYAGEANQNPASAPINQPSAYKLGAGDSINVTIFGEEALSGSYHLDQDGRMSMPLIGEIDLLGRSLNEARALITQKYQNGYLNNPAITIDVAAFRPFYILGEVNNPGEYEYSANLSVLNAVAVAGGFTYRARRSEAELHVPGVGEDIIKTDIPMGRIIRPGDIIFIEERFF